jgi:hypothetical protein
MGSPALLMIRGRQTARRSSFSREFPIVQDRRTATIIESAGEPVNVTLFSPLFVILALKNRAMMSPGSQDAAARRETTGKPRDPSIGFRMYYLHR